jgi:Mg-chelatase subunit ChlD
MNKNYTEIAFILDRSGSMDVCRDAAIAGFNLLLDEQQRTEGLAKLTLVLFDDEYLVPINALPVAEVIALDHETYVPRGSTALLDAIGRTVDDLGTRLAAMPEKNRPGQVIVAILTDGLENSSQSWTWKQIARVIKHETEQSKWTFLFLGANQDAIATAAQMNIAAANASGYVCDESGLPGCAAIDLAQNAGPAAIIRRKRDPRGGGGWGGAALPSGGRGRRKRAA